MRADTSIQPRGTSRMIDAGGIRLHALEYGHGEPTILVIPGITSPAITWEFVAEELAAAARVVVLDVRGRGLSDKPVSGFTLQDYANDVRSVAAAIAAGRLILLGHSMGARIAAAAVASDPEIASATIVVDPPLTGPGRPHYPFPLQVYVDALHESRAGATADDMARYYPTWPRRELEIRAQWLATCDETAVVETYNNFHTEEFFERWSQVPPPVMFMYGSDSPVVPRESIAEIQATNPHAEIVEVPVAGHMIPFDNLAGFVTPVVTFVSRSGPTRTPGSTS
ncbi:MAG TPA: alpha/beta hydrolase [Chloroflexota bacterium]